MVHLLRKFRKFLNQYKFQNFLPKIFLTKYIILLFWNYRMMKKLRIQLNMEIETAAEILAELENPVRLKVVRLLVQAGKGGVPV